MAKFPETTYAAAPFRSFFFAVTLLAAGMVDVPNIYGQSKTFDASVSPSCMNCVATLTGVAQLGRVDDDEFPAVNGSAASIAITSKGEFITTNLQLDRILVYSATGKLLHIIGRTGSGPGEFTALHHVALTRSDTLLAFDGNRLIVYSPNFKHVRTIAFPAPVIMPFIALEGDRVLTVEAAAYYAEPEVVIVDQIGGLSRPSAGRGGVYCPTCNSFLSTRTPDGGAWVVRSNRNEIERWSSNGRLLRTATIDRVPWFEPWVNTTKKADHPYKPQFAGIGEDEAGRLWVLGRYLAPNAKRPAELMTLKMRSDNKSLDVPPGGFALNDALHAQTTSVIHVFDGQSGGLYFSHVVSGKILKMLAPPYFAQSVQDSAGFDAVRIYRLDIKRR